MFSWRGYDQWDLLNGSIYGDTVSLMDIDHIMGIQNGYTIGILQLTEGILDRGIFHGDII